MERWNLFYQATSIGQYHGMFHSPYAGQFSLQNYPERDVSLTTTLFLGLRLEKNTLLYFDPEIAGGRGFSNVNGLANFSNGELPRVASATPKPYLARLYISHDFGFGKEKESFESDENQLAGQRPMNRYTITAGRFTLTDFFDNNRYSHDPRTQFMGWAVMYNGAWDYPADVRGYTWGWVHELHLRNWSFRYASAAMPRVANGLRLDHRLFRNRGDVFEGEYRYAVSKHTGAIRVLHYLNHANAGNYAEAIRQAERSGSPPAVTDTRRNGTLKYGFGVNVDQELNEDIGVFARLGWNDGKTESFAFTAIDRLITGGRDDDDLLDRLAWQQGEQGPCPRDVLHAAPVQVVVCPPGERRARKRASHTLNGLPETIEDLPGPIIGFACQGVGSQQNRSQDDTSPARAPHAATSPIARVAQGGKDSSSRRSRTQPARDRCA